MGAVAGNRRQFQDVFSEVIPFAGTVTLTAAAGAETSATVTVPGAEQGDAVLFGIVEDAESGSLTATVNAADTVEFILANATGSTITIASGTVVYGVVLKFSNLVKTA
jgi:hypothetical protein